MYFDRFDIVSAYYLYFTHYHEGQWSLKYKRLCKILTYFKPGLSIHKDGELGENAQEIYNNLTEKYNGT